MGNERQLQCKALRRREKSRRRGNNEEQWKEQCAEQWKQSEIRARADVSAGHIDTPKKKPPAAERRRAHTSETRISAIAHPSAERTLKSAPVIPAGRSKAAMLAHTRWPCVIPAERGWRRRAGGRPGLSRCRAAARARRSAARAVAAAWPDRPARGCRRRAPP